MIEITITFPPGIAWVQEWHNGTDGDFAAVNSAERFLSDAGFSIGSEQRGSPRGILFGEFDIQKWHNLDEGHREALHGTMTGNMREGPVTITIFSSAPDEAKSALAAEFAKRVG